MTLRLSIGARSDVGLVREHNEDSMYAGWQLLAVADGIGGAVAGEVASSVTIDALRRLDIDRSGPQPRDVLAELREAVHAANSALSDRINAEPQLHGMGTTLTAMLWQNERFGLAHVGDSRGYLARHGEVSQITRDQTFVQMLVDEGRITPEQATTHPQRSVILNALDGREAVEPDLSMRDVEAGDRYLLCSDGLSDYVARVDMVAELIRGDAAQPTCDRLVQLALDAGAPDNVTVVIADVIDSDSTQRLSPDAAAPALPIIGGAASELAATSSSDDAASAAQPGHRATRHHSLGRRLAAVAAVVVILVAAAIVGTVVYIHHQWYVADTSAGGTVGVYQGVKGSALGHHLSHLESPSDIPATSLPQDDQQRVHSGIDASNRTDAGAIVANLRQHSCQLAAVTATPTPSPTSARHGRPRPQPARTPIWCHP